MPVSPEVISTNLSLKPATNNTADVNALIHTLTFKPHLVLYVREYLQSQGLTKSAVQTATPASLATAYVKPAYLKGWRKRINPNWDLLDETDDYIEAKAEVEDIGASANATASSTDMQPWKPPAGAGADANASAAIMAQLAPRMATLVAGFVKEEVAKAKVELSPEAKAQIRTLAKEAAEATIAALAKPRVIEVHNITTGTVNTIGLQHERFPALLRAVQAKDHRGFRLNIQLTGPTGSGKTTAAENVAKALSLSFGTDGSLDADYKVLGFRDANGNVISTQFLGIYEGGGVYVADEIDNWLPSALLSLNAALANGFCASPRGLIRRHPDACIIACANTWGLGATNEYVGRAKQDAASLDRFQPKLYWPVDERLEAALAEAQDPELGPEWHATVLAARRKAARQGLRVIISPRATFAGIALLRSGFDHADVIDMTIHAGLSAEQKAAIAIDTVRKTRAAGETALYGT